MTATPSGERGAYQLVDVAVAFFVLVAILVTAPFWYHFIDMVSADAGPFSTVVLQLMPALLVLSLLVSAGVSARRGG